MIRMRVVVAPDAQTTFGGFPVGVVVIERLQFDTIVTRIFADVFKRQYFADDTHAVFEDAQQQPAAFFGIRPLAVALDLFDLSGCQFDAHYSSQNFSLRYLLASSQSTVTITRSSISS